MVADDTAKTDDGEMMKLERCRGAHTSSMNKLKTETETCEKKGQQQDNRLTKCYWIDESS